MERTRRFLRELARRNVWRAAALYVGATWALAQGIAQLAPEIGLPGMATRGFLVAAAIGFPFWVAFAWFYELTPQGFRREREVAAGESITRHTGRKLDFLIIGVLCIAVVLLLTDRLLLSRVERAAPAKSIAVLPFENLSDDKGGEYFVVGIQDEILTRLANIGDLKVVSRTSTEKYRSHAENLRQVGRELGVAHIVEGSVQRAGEQVRIVVQLIDSESDTHLWAQTYDRQMRDVFAVQSDVAGRIASALKLRLQPEETQALAKTPTADPAAYDLFLRAEYLADRGGIDIDIAVLRQSLAPYRQAIARDPAFALARARLSYAQSLLAWFGGMDITDADALEADARTNAEAALDLNPKLADGYIARGFSAYYGRQDYEAALAAFATAQQLRPNDAGAMAAAGYVYRRQGRNADSIRKLEEALDHDPRNTRYVSNLASTYMVVRRYADAERACRRALALDPDNVIANTMLSVAVLARTGDPVRALATLRGNHPAVEVQRAELLRLQHRYAEAIAIVEKVPDTAENFGGSTGGSKALVLGSLHQQARDTARARAYFEQIEERSRRDLADAEARPNPKEQMAALQNLADVELGLGRPEEALRLTQQAQVLIDRFEDQYLEMIFSSLSADLYGRVGRADLAVPLLDRILGAPDGGMAYSSALLPVDPAWDRFRDDPRFIALLEKYPASDPEEPAAAPHETVAPLR